MRNMKAKCISNQHCSDPWYAAFKVKPGDKLWLPPAERVRVW